MTEDRTKSPRAARETPDPHGSEELASDVFERLDVPGLSELPIEPRVRETSRAEPPRGGHRPLYRADPDRVLRVLSANQFEDPYLAFRELYANALDAVRGRPDARIEIRVASDRVTVEDNGTGLDDAGLEALTTLGASTRRGKDAIGRFGIGFASVFDPQLGLGRVDFTASRPGRETGVRVRFEPDVGGGVAIRVDDVPRPRAGGSKVELLFDPARAKEDRVARVVEVFETHAAYSGVETILNGRLLGKELADYIRTEIKNGEWSPVERQLIAATAVKGPVGVAAIDPSRQESKFRAYQRGLFICEVPLTRVQGKPWPRGVFGAVHAEGLDLVASRNGFVENEKFERFQEELRRLAYEAAYRVVRYFESGSDGYARIVLLDALRRGLRSTTPEAILAESDDLFSSAIVRSPLFRAWGTKKTYSFEELVALKQSDRFRALAYRPAWRDRDDGPIMRADDSIERDIFRKLSGLRDMPAAARAEEIARPSLFSRFRDRLLSGPRAEYSLFQRQVDSRIVSLGTIKVVEALQEFLSTEEVTEALARLLPGPLPRLGYGISRNAFGPVAAYRLGEIRFNTAHRAMRKLSKEPNADLAARALLPVLAHELAHMCHELHDLDFYRTSRAILRALAVAAAKIDARASEGETVAVKPVSKRRADEARRRAEAPKRPDAPSRARGPEAPSRAEAPKRTSLVRNETERE
ncbi:ATP-binding protein [Myxococcota bacterium]|nr:ATP-binding protein [Myxococcota bacterium]